MLICKSGGVTIMYNKLYMKGNSIMNIGYAIGKIDTKEYGQKDKIEKWFIDIDGTITDTKLSERPQLKALFRFLRKGDNIYFYSFDSISTTASWATTFFTKDIGVYESGDREKPENEISDFIKSIFKDSFEIGHGINQSNISEDASKNMKDEIHPEENGEKYISYRANEKKPQFKKKTCKRQAWLVYREFFEKKCKSKTELCKVLASKFNVSNETMRKWLNDESLSFTID